MIVKASDDSGYANVFPRNHSNTTNSSNDSLNQILAYYEKNKDQLKADLDNKLVVIKNNRIYIKQQAIREIIAILENQKNQEKIQSKPQLNIKKLNKLTSNAIVNIIQELINRGEIQTAYTMYSLLCDKISFPEDQVLLWAHAYIGKSHHIAYP